MNNVVWGIKRGLGIALLFCVWVSIIYAIKGTKVFEQQGVPLLTLITAYLAIGTISGAIVGGLRPFLGSAIGSYGVGLAAALPIAFGIVVAMNGFPSHWPASAVAFAVVFGGLGGIVIGNEFNSARGDGKSR